MQWEGHLMNLLKIVLFLAALGTLQAQPYQWTTVAGSAGYGTADGTNSDARFWVPMGIASDPNGSFFASDYRNNNIRRLARSGTNWIVSTIAGTPRIQGGADGTNGDAQFYNPKGVAVDAQGNVYVADSYNHAIRKLAPEGTNWVVRTIAGLAHTPGGVDGTNSDARFTFPYGVLADHNGIVYVTDNTTVRKLTPLGTDWVVTTIAGRSGYSGTADGTNSTARFLYPSDPVMDGSGAIYVTDTRNFTIRKLTPIGTNWVVTTIAGQAGLSGSADGTNSDARFYYSDGLTMDPEGNLFVADTGNHTIRYVTQAGTNWVVRTIAGLAGVSGDVDGSNSLARFNYPHGVAIASDGSLLVTDGSNYKIRNVRLEGTNWVVRTIAGRGGPESRDGPDSTARFNHPWGIALASHNEVYVSDENNHTIRRVTKDGNDWLVDTVAGLAGTPGSNDGTNNGARFKTPRGLAMDPNGTLYVSDHSNNIIRKVSLQVPAVVVTTIAGTPGMTGSVDGTNGSALFNRPLGITAGRSGNLYVADNQAIRWLAAEGTNWITRTIVGLAGTSGYLDGSNSTARFNGPCGVAVDAATNIYVADSGNYVIRKIMPLGTNWIVSTIAGLKGSVGRQDGTNSNARFWNPNGVAVDGSGIVYVSDAENHTIRKITPASTNWVVTTIGGLGTVIGIPDFQGNADGVGSAARFAWPTALIVDNDGTIFVADYWNNTIRQGTPLLPILGMPQVNGGMVHLTWSANASQQYQLQTKADLTLADWINVGSAISATNGMASAEDSVLVGTQRFYRVLLLP